jgi:hypothetical protein
VPFAVTNKEGDIDWRFQMKVVGIRCKRCRAFMYSRTKGDRKSCFCGAVGVDRGQEDPYVWALGDYGVCEEHDVEATKEELHEDWEQRTAKYGYIFPKSIAQ